MTKVFGLSAKGSARAVLSSPHTTVSDVTGFMGVPTSPALGQLGLLLGRSVSEPDFRSEPGHKGRFESLVASAAKPLR